MKKILIAFSAVALGVLPGCVGVKEYQKQYVKDKDMSLDVSTAEQPDLNAQTYREGASGADGSSGGGGCGCN